MSGHIGYSMGSPGNLVDTCYSTASVGGRYDTLGSGLVVARKKIGLGIVDKPIFQGPGEGLMGAVESSAAVDGMSDAGFLDPGSG